MRTMLRDHQTTSGVLGVAPRVIAGLIAVLLMLLVGVQPAGADSLDELKARKQAAERKRADARTEIADLESALEDTDAEISAAYVRLKEIEAELPVAQAALDEAEAELIKAQRAAEDLAERLEETEQDEVALEAKVEEQSEEKKETRSQVAELARRAYRGEGNPDGVSLLVGAESAQDFVNQFSLSQTAIRTQSKSLDTLQQSEATSLNTQVRLEAVREAIADLKAEADAAVIEADLAKVEAEARRTEVEGLIAEAEESTRIIEARKETQLEQKADAEKAATKLSNDILRISGLTKKEQKRVKKAQAKAAEKARKAAAVERRKNANKPATPANPSRPAKPSTPSPSKPKPSGKFLAYPTAVPHITSSYGWRLHPVYGYERLHAGTDFRAYCGTPIMASAGGRVVGSTYRAGYGNQVLVNHGTVGGANLMTSYNHLSRFAVSSGARVKKGQVVGYSGNTGVGTACHLHLEVYVNGATVNPMSKL